MSQNVTRNDRSDLFQLKLQNSSVHQPMPLSTTTYNIHFDADPYPLRNHQYFAALSYLLCQSPH